MDEKYFRNSRDFFLNCYYSGKLYFENVNKIKGYKNNKKKTMVCFENDETS